MIPSGIPTLDERLGGLMPRRIYLLTGAPGTGKTVACLEFLNVALEAGEPAVMLTNDDPTDVIEQGRYLGIELDEHLESERLVLLRYQLDFARRFARSATPELAFDELRRLIGSVTPSRLVVDSVAPILDGGSAAGIGVHALANFLESLGGTSVATYSADLAGLYDRRLEPLAQRAAAILHFECDRDRGHRVEVRKVRFGVKSTAPISFTIQPGIGIVPLAETRQRRLSDVAGPSSNRLLVLAQHDGLPDDVLATLRSQYQVTTRAQLSHAFADQAAASGAVLIEVRRDSVNDALSLVRELRRSGNRAPIMLVTRFTLRADDRARALRAGADEFLSGDLHPNELLARLEAAIERGHVGRAPTDVEVPLVSQPQADGRVSAFDMHDFRNAITQHLAQDRAPFFTLVRLRLPHGDKSAPQELAAAVMRALRLEGGDLAGVLDDGVAIYLHSARRKDVAPFVERVREEWLRSGGGELEVDLAAYPAEEDRIQSLLEERVG
jgi:KaiC/GvpD/RAD55 family RecA-like ATPase/DNA-binding NarL/FixJ family response regulator